MDLLPVWGSPRFLEGLQLAESRGLGALAGQLVLLERAACPHGEDVCVRLSAQLAAEQLDTALEAEYRYCGASGTVQREVTATGVTGSVAALVAFQEGARSVVVNVSSLQIRDLLPDPGLAFSGIARLPPESFLPRWLRELDPVAEALEARRKLYSLSTGRSG